MGPTFPFLAETSFVLEQVGDIFGFLANVGTLVLFIFIDVLEFFQRLDDVYVVSESYRS